VIAAALIAAALATAPEHTERFEGVARLPDGRVAYRETHEVHLRDGRVASAETRYADDQGRVIARLLTNYSANPFAPAYEYLDLRTGTREALRREGGRVALQDGDRSTLLDPPSDRPLVAGQGLDRFTRANLDALARGEVLEVELALPGRLDSYAFRIRAEAAGPGVLRVRFEPQSFLLRLLAPSIEADYAAATGRLLRYRGVSNVAGPDGDPVKVEIAYEYAEPAPR
jgi:hypothetical protein